MVWLTDLHLNFCNDASLERFYETVEAAKPDVLLIGGDTNEAAALASSLKTIGRRFPIPIYFVLGNHDYYHGSIDHVREEMTTLSNESEFLRWLPTSGVVALTENVGLVGHGGWGDGRNGSYATSNVMLNDYVLIEELAGLAKGDRLIRLNALGDEAAACLSEDLSEALAQFDHVIVLTHVPPFPEATWHEGEVSGPEFLPHFSCKAVGAVLLDTMSGQRGKQCLALCGHTHSPGEAWPLPNLRVLTGGAEYGQPSIQRVFDLDRPETVFG